MVRFNLSDEDDVFPGPGDDNSGRDSVYDRGGNDWINGDGGRDRLYGEAGDDALDGGAENDRLYGGDGRDRLIGGADGSSDVLDGGSGDDVLKGGRGNDDLFGDDGDDEIVGGKGSDALGGGGGADGFLIGDDGSGRAGSPAVDDLYDFSGSEGDRLVLRGFGEALDSFGEFAARAEDGRDINGDGETDVVVRLGDGQVLNLYGTTIEELRGDVLFE